MRRLMRMLLILQLGAVAAAQTTGGRSWQVKLADGSGTKLSVTSNAGLIEFRNERAVVFTIPADSIREILHSTQRLPRSTTAYDFFENMCCGGTESHVLSTLAMAIAAPMGSAKEHYVEVHWYHKAEGAVVMEVGKNDYAPFMDWLQQLSGRKWRDIDSERQQMLDSIEKRAAAAFPVPILYPQENGDWLHYTYSALLLDDSDRTQILFFKGAVKPKNLVWILPVVREWSVNKCVSDVEVLYGKCHAEACEVEAILLPNVT